MGIAQELKAARARAGLSQRALAAASGVSQPRIAAYEAARVVPSPQTVQRLKDATRVRPSHVLMTKRDQVRAIIERAGGTDPRVFGSVARGTDTPDSDIDLLVHLPKAWDLLDLVGLEMELEHLVGYPVDIVDDTRAGGPVIRNAAGEAVPL